MTGESWKRLPFTDGPLPGAFERRVIAIAPGRMRAFDPAEWRDAIVVVERGRIDVECVGGTCQRFGRGAVISLDGLPVRRLHNRYCEPAVLIVVSPLAAAWFPGPGAV